MFCCFEDWSEIQAIAAEQVYTFGKSPLLTHNEMDAQYQAIYARAASKGSSAEVNLVSLPAHTNIEGIQSVSAKRYSLPAEMIDGGSTASSQGPDRMRPTFSESIWGIWHGINALDDCVLNSPWMICNKGKD